MSRFEEDVNRGCLANGEPLEALYGIGWWTEMPEPEPEHEWDSGECPFCHSESYYLDDKFYECLECKHTWEDCK